MVWSSQAPQGFESNKVRFELVQYLHGRVLDLGCGVQKIFPSASIIGVDDDRDLKLFGSKANADFYHDCTKLPYQDGFADTVFSSHLLEHVQDYKNTLKEWWRLVKPGGYLVLYLPHADHYPNIGMPGGNKDHKHDFRNEDITHAMQEVAWRSGCGWNQIRDEVRAEDWEYSFLQVYQKIDRPVTHLYKPETKPEKSIGIVRLGAHGDALWISAVLPHLKAEGYHITLYTQPQGEASLRHDPNIDRIICQPLGIFGDSPGMLQTAYWRHEEPKYDRFVNLVGVVERQLLTHIDDFAFFMPHDQRKRLMDANYMEEIFRWFGIKYDPAKARVQFHPTSEELAWAMKEVAKLTGPLVLINPSGSSFPKYWPHSQRLMEILNERGVHGWVVGDLRGAKLTAPERGRVIGTSEDIRKVFTLAKFADVVVGTESAIINSVSHESNAKIVMLSHSSSNNLTRDWVNTIDISPVKLACYPCHRIHVTHDYCSLTENGFAACQEAASPEVVAEAALQWIESTKREVAHG